MTLSYDVLQFVSFSLTMKCARCVSGLLWWNGGFCWLEQYKNKKSA